MSNHTIPNDVDPNTPLIVVTLSNILKLTSHNYLSWKLQITATLDGYGLFKYLDGSFPTPSKTTVTNNVSNPNPAYLTWVRQDRLLFGALIGTLDHHIVPLISLATTTKEMWDILAQTFASSSRGHIKQLKAKFKTISKGPQTITDFMHAIKACTDHLALLGSPIQQEDITDRVLEGLDDSYQGVIDAVNARDSPISFAELHEKLINRELTIKTQPLLGVMPATVNHTTRRFAPTYPHRSSQQSPNSYRPNHSSTSSPNHSSTSSYKPQQSFTGTRPFLGKCQWCHTKGHSLQKCPVFMEKHPTLRPPPPPTYTSNSPQAHVATASASPHSTPWLLDSGASHHVTHDLANLSLHQPYDGTEEIVIGDGTGLPITHTGSSLISSSSKSLSLSNVLCVPTMRRNIISISQFCKDNNLLITFSSDFYLVKDRLTGALLLQGPTKNGIYELTSSLSSIVAYSSVTATLIDWHHRLGHPSLAVFKPIVASLKLNISTDFSFNCNACQCNKSHKLPFNQNTLTSNSPLDLLYTDLWTSPVYSFT